MPLALGEVEQASPPDRGPPPPQRSLAYPALRFRAASR